MTSRRLRFYSRNDYMPDHWYSRCGIPFRDTDDDQRLMIVWGCTLFGYVGFAYRNCPCEDCMDARQQNEVVQAVAEPVNWDYLKERYGEDFVEDAQKYQLRMQQLPDRRA